MIDQFILEIREEFNRILDFWTNKMPDKEFCGFLGELDFYGNPVKDAPKGIILNTRILWTFSSAALFTNEQKHKNIADQAYQYLLDHFLDKEFGGVYWLVNHKGELENGRKQVYAQAFSLYALSAYYQLTQRKDVLDLAIQFFNLIEEKTIDTQFGGYIDAFGQQWQELADTRLSEKDLNEKKILNTHLHILEAYTLFYKIYPDNKVKEALTNLINLFTEKFINNEFHLNMFFDEEWTPKSQLISYGHDIETSWLLWESVEVLPTFSENEKIKSIVIQIADTFLKEAISPINGVINEFDQETGHTDKDYHWWPQIEGMVGLINAWQLTKKDHYLKSAISIWDFIKNNVLDYENGEWHWLVSADGKIDQSYMKAGFWKCPYHNTRGCIEIMSRLSNI